MRKILLLVILLLLIPTAYSESTSCFDDGSMKISDLSEKTLVYTAKPGTTKWYRIEGDWNENTDGTFTFQSEEMVFSDPESKKYVIKYGRNIEAINCPGFKFSCKMINISVLSCFNTKDTFYADFLSQNYQIDQHRNYRLNDPLELVYEVKTQSGSIHKYSSSVKSAKMKYIDIVEEEYKKSSQFSFRWPTTENVTQFSITYAKCGTRPFYTYKKCTQQEVCVKNTDCNSGEYCNNFNCYPLTCHGCSYQEEHKCIQYECCSDDACGTGQFCKENKCTNLICSNNFIARDHVCQELEKEQNKLLPVSQNASINKTIKSINETINQPNPTDKNIIFKKITDFFRKLFNLNTK